MNSIETIISVIENQAIDGGLGNGEVMGSEYKEWVAQYNESQPISFYDGAIAAWQHRQTEVVMKYKASNVVITMFSPAQYISHFNKLTKVKDEIRMQLNGMVDEPIFFSTPELDAEKEKIIRSYGFTEDRANRISTNTMNAYLNYYPSP